MAKIRFLFENLFSASGTTLTASSAVTSLPATAAQNPDRSYVWRSSTSTGTQTLDIDLGSAQSVSAVALANVSLLGSGAVELSERGSAGSPGAATLVATLPAADRDTRTTFAFFAAQSKRHWQLKWTNPGSDSDYAELGYAFLGGYLEPTFNVSVPAKIVRPDPSVGAASIDGQETYARRTKFFEGAWEFDLVPEAQLDDLRDLWDTLGIGMPMFMVLDTSLAWTCWYARLSGALSVSLAMVAGRYTVAFPWREVR